MKTMKFRDILGTPLMANATKIVLLGAGELGKEIAIEAQRLGVEVITVDRYDNPPAAQVAHRHYTVDMRDGNALKAIIYREKPDAIVPEIEAINTDALVELEEEGFNVIPNAEATRITMDRIRLRKLAAERAGVKTSRYKFAYNLDELKDACESIGYPCLVKARMSSGGLGSTVVYDYKDIEKAYENAIKYARGFGEHVIVEEMIKFDMEVTELPLACLNLNEKPDILLPRPVGHVRTGSHFHVSWQPFIDIDEETDESAVPFQGYGSNLHLMEDKTGGKPLWSSEWNDKKLPGKLVREAENKIYETAKKVVKCLLGKKGGFGIFGCELFIKFDEKRPEVYFNEISPRPHDTGMVTLVSQNMSETALHVYAILRFPIPEIINMFPGAAHVILSEKDGVWGPTYRGLREALMKRNIVLRFFGKPCTYKHRRMGLALAIGKNTIEARIKAMEVAHTIERGL